MANRQILLSLDDLDYDAIQEAIARRQLFRVMPDGESNTAGAVLAEICRGWVEFTDMSKEEWDE